MAAAGILYDCLKWHFSSSQMKSGDACRHCGLFCVNLWHFKGSVQLLGIANGGRVFLAHERGAQMDATHTFALAHRHLFRYVNRKWAAPVKLQINYTLFHNIELKYRRILPTLFTPTHTHTCTHMHLINMCQYIYDLRMCICTYRERAVYGNIITLRSRMMDTLHTPVTANGNYAQHFSVRAVGVFNSYVCILRWCLNTYWLTGVGWKPRNDIIGYFVISEFSYAVLISTLEETLMTQR